MFLSGYLVGIVWKNSVHSLLFINSVYNSNPHCEFKQTFADEYMSYVTSYVNIQL